MTNHSYIQEELPVGYTQETLPIEELEDFTGYNASIGGRSLHEDASVSSNVADSSHAESGLVKTRGWDIVDPVGGTVEIWDYIGENGFEVSFEIVKDKDGNILHEYSDGNVESLRQSVAAYQAIISKVVRESTPTKTA